MPLDAGARLDRARGLVAKPGADKPRPYRQLHEAVSVFRRSKSMDFGEGCWGEADRPPPALKPEFVGGSPGGSELTGGKIGAKFADRSRND